MKTIALGYAMVFKSVHTVNTGPYSTLKPEHWQCEVSDPDLVDLVHHPEGAAVELLQGHEVEHGGDAALPPALVVRRQLMQLCAVVELHPDADPILIVLFLYTHTQTNTVYRFSIYYTWTSYDCAIWLVRSLGILGNIPRLRSQTRDIWEHAWRWSRHANWNK